MRLRDKINQDLTAAMKSREAERLSVLRMMKAAIRNKEIDSRQELEDAQAVQVLVGLIKQRKDSVEQFTKGGRLDLADKEEEIGKVIDEVIQQTGAASIKDMGKVMKECMTRFSGRPVDGGKVSEMVKARLP